MLKIKGCCFDGDKQVATRPRRIDGTPWATDDARYAIDLIKLELRNTKKHRLWFLKEFYACEIRKQTAKFLYIDWNLQWYKSYFIASKSVSTSKNLKNLVINMQYGTTPPSKN